VLDRDAEVEVEVEVERGGGVVYVHSLLSSLYNSNRLFDEFGT